MSSVPPCLTCGSCCFSQLETYVQVTGDDYERLGDGAADATSFIGNRCYMRMVDGHCAALTVGPHEHVCSVYERRPQICRDLQRETPSCAAERTAKSERAESAQHHAVRLALI